MTAQKTNLPAVPGPERSLLMGAEQTRSGMLVVRRIAVACALILLVAALSFCRPTAVPFADLSGHPDYVDLERMAELRLDLRYAGQNNFLGTVLYGDGHRAYLHRDAAARLARAIAFLQMERPDTRLRVWDALRPRSVQRQMWQHVRGTEQQKYVGDPERGSVHNYGMAIDLTVEDASGAPLEMGTDFDDFRPLAEPAQEHSSIAAGTLSRSAWKNRLLLRRAMLRAGFEPLTTEWWHFDALPGWLVRERYPIVE